MMALKKIKMEDFTDATPGTLVGIDYAQGARVGRPVRVMAELREMKKHPETGEWIWASRVVKCSPALEHMYLGADLWVYPQNEVMVIA